MSRTKKKTKAPGFDYWSRRCFGSHCMTYGKVAKWITKHRERRRDKEMCHKAMIDNDDYELRFKGE